jgi:hypothetical protein
MSLTFISLATVLGKRNRSVDELTPIHGWQLLGDDQPWKKFGDYWRKQNVETTRDSPCITLAPEEWDPKNRISLSFLTDNKIIVRNHYKLFYDFVQKIKDDIRFTGLFLTGQPGTGVSPS